MRVQEGSGNVFRDLGFPNAEREQLKADLTLQIFRLIKARDLAQPIQRSGVSVRMTSPSCRPGRRPAVHDGARGGAPPTRPGR